MTGPPTARIYLGAQPERDLAAVCKALGFGPNTSHYLAEAFNLMAQSRLSYKEGSKVLALDYGMQAAHHFIAAVRWTCTETP